MKEQVENQQGQLPITFKDELEPFQPRKPRMRFGRHPDSCPIQFSQRVRSWHLVQNSPPRTVSKRSQQRGQRKSQAERGVGRVMESRVLLFRCPSSRLADVGPVDFSPPLSRCSKVKATNAPASREPIISRAPQPAPERRSRPQAANPHRESSHGTGPTDAE